MMDTLFALIGNFHPVLVHLPIGFLLLAVLFQWLIEKEKYAGILPAVKIAFLLGLISAILSCITGWSLSLGGEYDEDTLDYHKWMGISVAVISLIGYLLINNSNQILKRSVSILTLLLIIITGHLGGTLTHGEGFLTKAFTVKSDSSKSARKNIVNVQEAQVFADIIQPILQDKCGGCHSATKQKGGLRLDGKDWILKGGKDGKIFESGNADASELYKRATLDPLEEKHMPPKGKPQLTEQEMVLINWWISSNAGFDKKVKEVAQTPKVLPALLAMQSAAVFVKKPAIPEGRVDAAPEAALDALRKAGVIVLPVAAKSNWLTANFISIQKVSNETIALLAPISKQLVWLKLGYAELSDHSWKLIGQCTNLTKLSIEHTNLTDASIKNLSALNNLLYLNLVGTKISVKGIEQLKSLTKLEELYIGQTVINGNDVAVIQKQFRKTVIDSGNYRVENLSTDTQLLKAPMVKK